MNTQKALLFFLINTLLLGGFPDFRINSHYTPLYPEFADMQTVPAKTYNLAELKYPARFPSPYELIATPTPKPTPQPTATPAPTPTPKPTPIPTQVPLGKKKVQSTKPGNLTFQYPEAAPLNTDTTTYTLLVNKEYPISSKYIPYMVEPEVEIYHKGINERRYLQPIAATALEEMFAAAENDGLHMVLRCGFRSYKLQKSIYVWNLKNAGYYEVTRYHALAGTSEHQTGLSVDLCCKATNYENNFDFLNTEEYAWLLENAHQYGWILRYPENKTDITGYNFEPWHFRYVGIELATYLKEQDIVLEEYYGALPTANLLAVPEEYWTYLTKDDYKLMMKEIAAYEKMREEQAKQPTANPEPEVDTPDTSPTPTTAPEEDTPNISPTPTITPEDDTPDVFPTPSADPEDEAAVPEEETFPSVPDNASDSKKENKKH